MENNLKTVDELEIPVEDLLNGVVPKFTYYDKKRIRDKKTPDDGFLPRKHVEMLLDAYVSDLALALNENNQLHLDLEEKDTEMNNAVELLENIKAERNSFSNRMSSNDGQVNDVTEILAQVKELKKADQEKLLKLKDDRDNLKIQMSELESEVAELNSEIEKLRREKEELLAEKQRLENDVIEVKNEHNFAINQLNEFSNVSELQIDLIKKYSGYESVLNDIVESARIEFLKLIPAMEYVDLQALNDDIKYVEYLYDDLNIATREYYLLSKDFNELLVKLRSNFEKYGVKFDTSVFISRNDSMDNSNIGIYNRGKEVYEFEQEQASLEENN